MSLNMPYEPVPDGPIDAVVDVVLCGGIGLRAAFMPHQDGGKVPLLLFDFHLATGGQLFSIALAMSAAEFVDFAELVDVAVRHAIEVAS